MGPFIILYHPVAVKKDMPRLDKAAASRIRLAIETKLTTRPELYGSPLRATLKKFWKLRVGDWRVMYEIRGEQVRVLAIAHRSDVYKMIDKRTA